MKIEEAEKLQLTEQEAFEVSSGERNIIEKGGELFFVVGSGLKLIETDYIHGWDV